eukprot:1935799-Rhodomonas_salina.2
MLRRERRGQPLVGCVAALQRFKAEGMGIVMVMMIPTMGGYSVSEQGRGRVLNTAFVKRKKDEADPREVSTARWWQPSCQYLRVHEDIWSDLYNEA